MDDKADPLSGWPIWEVCRQPWPAKQDCYGKLHAYLREIFAKFIWSLSTVNLSFEMYCLDARELKDHLDRDRYNRIEVTSFLRSSYSLKYKKKRRKWMRTHKEHF